MKKLILSCLFSIICLNSLFAQNNDEPKLTPAEILQAQQLAARFYNRYTQTQDVEPLIKEFFISDYKKQINYCFKTGDCGGHNRDFWTEFDGSFEKIKSDADFQNYYITISNYLYLMMRSLILLSPKMADIPETESPSKTKQNIRNGLKSLLKKEPKLLKKAVEIFQTQMKDDSEKTYFEPPKFKNIRQFKQYYSEIDRVVETLKIIELKLRIKQGKSNPNLNFRYFPTDFRIDIEIGSFYNFANNTKLIQVWDNIWEDKNQSHKRLPFIMDLIKENGKLKVVAIYPPID